MFDLYCIGGATNRDKILIRPANVCRDLQGLCGGFLQYLQGKTWNIYRFSLQSLQIAGIAGKICKYYRIFPTDIAKKPRRVPVNPCKHLQCMQDDALYYLSKWLNIFSLINLLQTSKVLFIL